MRHVPPIGRDTEQLAEAMRSILHHDAPKSFRQFWYFVVAGIGCLALAAATFFGVNTFRTPTGKSTNRSAVYIENVPLVHPFKPPIAAAVIPHAYYVKIKPPAPLLATRKKVALKLKIEKVDNSEKDEDENAVPPYRNGQNARQFTGEALRRAIVEDQRITTQANLDAQPRNDARGEDSRKPGP